MKRWSFVGIFALVLAAAFIVASCGEAPCGPANCYGCCNSAGSCVSPSSLGCGANGGQCVPCLVNQICNGGVCMAGSGGGGGSGGAGGGGNGGGGGAGSCGPANCAGCCTSSGTCVNPANTAANCGASGGTCNVCSGTNVCTNGRCGDPRDTFLGTWAVKYLQATTWIDGQVTNTGGPVTAQVDMVFTRATWPSGLVAALAGKEFFSADVVDASKFAVKVSTNTVTDADCTYVTTFTSGNGEVTGFGGAQLTLNLLMNGSSEATCTTVPNFTSTSTQTITATRNTP